MSRRQQPLEAARDELIALDVAVARALGARHPAAGFLHGALADVRANLQRALDHPAGDAADASVASTQLRALTQLQAMLPDLEPKPADLFELDDRLGWVCDLLVKAGGRVPE